MAKPACSRCARILPVRRAATASGLMMARVNIGCRVSGGDEAADQVRAREKADDLALAHDRKAIDVLAAHQRGDVGERLVLGEAQHGARHGFSYGNLARVARSAVDLAFGGRAELS